MSDILKYNDYVSSVHFSANDEVFHGKISGKNDQVTFEGKSVSELKKAFKEAIDDYLHACKELNKNPDKVYK